MKIDLTRVHELVNEIYLPAFKFTGRFLVEYGGSGSGKSWSIAQKIIYRMITEDDHNILCVRNTGNTLHKSCFALLQGTINAWGLAELFRINEAEGKEKIIFKPNGNQIIFSGLDDVEKLKSIYNITSVWINKTVQIKPL